jgi:PII-like signaling protein
MKTVEVTMVRIYLTEEKAHLNKLMACLHDEEKVRGVTVFRGITGFGKSGKLHSSTLLDMSLNLPVVVEFFDKPPKVERILEHLNERIGAGHIVCWSARVNEEED